MDSQFLPTIKSLIAAAWRRRYLLAMPVLLMLPLSLAWALYGPRTYVAKTLMLLQESQSANPLARQEVGQPTRIQERVAGLQALLKSDRVLGNVYRDLSGDTTGNPKDMAIWIREFSQYLSLELIGSDFLEFQLKGGNPRGLGKRLEAVTSRYLEALQPEQNSQFASQVLLDKRKEEMDVAARSLSVFRQRLGERLPGGLAGPHGRLEEARKHVQVKEGQLQRINADLQDTRSRIADNIANNGRIEQEIGRARTELAAIEARGNGGEAELARVRARLGDLLAIQRLEGQRGTIDKELKDLRQEEVNLERTLRQTQPLALELSRLEREAASTKEAYEDYLRRYTRVASMRTGGILNAPERIKLIDAPRDPEFPTNSAVRLAIVGLLASLGLALGLAVGAEMLDARVRNAEEAAALSGLPILARLA